MITIRKIDGGEVFDLPAGYVVEAEKNNPLFQKKGSQTVPINFPATIRNNRMLKFPHRIDNTNKKEETIPVIVETGSVQQKGLLSVNSASEKIISANIGYDESEMYATMKDMQLCNMPVLKKPDYIKSFGGSNIDQKIDSMLAHLTAVMKEKTEADYYVFPVIVKKDVVELDDNNSKTYLEIINEVDPNFSSDGKIAELKARQNRTIIRYEGNEEIELTAPKGYGVSPFLRVFRLLEIIFDNFDFKLSENPFKEHRQLKKMVVLNNTIDAILTGILSYKDLMPDCTIQEFLDSLFAKFGTVFFVDSNSKTVRIKFLKDIINPDENSNINNLNTIKTKEPEVSFQPAKQLRLKMNRELEDSKTLVDTMEEFLEKFAYQFSETPRSGNVSQIFNRTENTYIIINVFITHKEKNRETSSDFFDWDKKTKNIGYEDIEMRDLCLPLYHVPGALFATNIVMLQYLTGYKHNYSDVFIGGNKEEDQMSCAKIAFAFAWGLTSSNPSHYRLFFASQFNRDETGNFVKDNNGIKYDISLTCNREDGLYNRFWKEYDAFLRHSNQIIKCDLHLSDKAFVEFKIDEKVSINNQPLVTEQIKYKFSNVSDKISESLFRTLRLYEPHDLENEQKIPKYGPQKYYWKFTTVVDGFRPAGITPRFEFDSFFTINGVQTPIIYMSFLPPTEEQFIAQETRIFKYREIYGKQDIIGYYGVVNITVTYKPALII